MFRFALPLALVAALAFSAPPSAAALEALCNSSGPAPQSCIDFVEGTIDANHRDRSCRITGGPKREAAIFIVLGNLKDPARP